MEGSKGSGLILGVAAVFLAPLMIVVLFILGISGASSASGVCAAPGASGDASAVEGAVAGGATGGHLLLSVRDRGGRRRPGGGP